MQIIESIAEQSYAVEVSPEAAHKIFLGICNDTTMMTKEKMLVTKK